MDNFLLKRQCLEIFVLFCLTLVPTSHVVSAELEQSDSQSSLAASDITKNIKSFFSKGIYHFPTGIYNITSNVSFAGPVVFDEGAIFNISDGVTTTFESDFKAGESQVFSGNGKVAGLRKLAPEWFGAVGDGIADDTHAIQKALDCFTHNAYSGGVGYVLLLKKAYLVSSLTVSSAFVTIHAEGAWLMAKNTGEYPHLLKFTGYANRITGTLYIDGSYNLGYDCMVNVNVRHFISHNVTIFRASLPWLIGNRNWATSGIPGDAEKGDSEIEIFGGATIHCLRGVEAVGANTIVNFSNVLLYSFPWTLPKEDPRKAAWESADSTVVRSIGAGVFITGGGLANFTTKVPLLEVQPIRCTMPQYYSNYGVIYVANANLEVGNLFAAVNPNKIPTQDSKGNKVVQKAASLVLSNCGGYMPGDQVPINTDPMFTGYIKINNCNFHGINRKSVYAKIGNPLARIEIDEGSFNDDRIKGLDSVVGGTRIFSDRMIFEAKRTAQVIGEKNDSLIFARPTITPDTANFQSCYNPQTGVFTTPVGGLVNVRIAAGTRSANGKRSDTTEMTILKNGKPVAVSDSQGRSSNIIFTIDSLAEGDTIQIQQNVESGAITLSGDDFNYFQIVASRH